MAIIKARDDTNFILIGMIAVRSEYEVNVAGVANTNVEEELRG
jgi:hypothetical protein